MWCDSYIVVRHLPAWFPGAEFQRTAAHWRERLALAVSAPFERVKSDVVSDSLVVNPDIF